jgi:FkbM family methyltransferase
MLSRSARRIIEFYLDKKGLSIVSKKDFTIPSEINFFYIISELYCRTHPNSTIIQIGANDGILCDPLHKILNNNALNRAILFEPVPHIFSKLEKNYRFRDNTICENSAVSDFDGEMQIYFYEDGVVGVPSWTSAVISLDRSLLESHLAAPGMRELAVKPAILSEKVVVISYSKILERYSIEKIGILQIDTEGHDAIIVDAALRARLRPSIINFEFKHLTTNKKKEISEKLTASGYSLYEYGGDMLAINAALIDGSFSNT